LLFLLARPRLGPWFGAVAVAFFLLLGVCPAPLGLTANAEHFVLLPVVAGLCLLDSSERARRLLRVFASGVLLGLAFLAKQHGGFFILVGALLVVVAWRGEPWSRMAGAVAVFAGGAALPYLAVCLCFALLGAFSPFWFWTVSHARSYVSYASLDAVGKAFAVPFWEIVAQAPVVWLLAALGVVFWFAGRARGGFVKLSWGGFLAASWLAIVPGFYFRPHYFLLVLPAVALFAAAGLARATLFLHRLARPGWGRALSAVLVAIALLTPIAANLRFFAEGNLVTASRNLYHANFSVFPEIEQFARHLATRAAPTASVAVVGSEPELYFYLKRTAPTGYIYFYFLTERHPYTARMQGEFIREIERAAPDYLVYAPSWDSEHSHAEEIDRMRNWFTGYCRAHYGLVGFAYPRAATETAYVWREEPIIQVLGERFIALYKRLR
jgi:hypothetical protein